MKLYKLWNQNSALFPSNKVIKLYNKEVPLEIDSRYYKWFAELSQEYQQEQEYSVTEHSVLN